MKQLLDDLIKLIQNQTELYKKLLEVLQDENDIIVSSSLAELTANNKKKEVVILQIKLLDESCTKLVETIFSRLPFSRPEGPDAIRLLIDKLKKPHQQTLADFYNKLIAVVRDVKEVNSYNERMIKGSLRAIKSTISFLSSAAIGGAPIYENSGQMRMDKVVRPMLREEA
ncbi:flagellar protein FlgN [Thermodesulfobacteriota bacterium]